MDKFNSFDNMMESASKVKRIKLEEVKYGHLNDLPEDLRIKVMSVHKIICTKARELFGDKNYADIANSQWAKTMLEEFLAAPNSKSKAGSVTLFKKGKRCRCMIQITNHVDNDRSDINHELFHDFIRNVHQKIRSKIRRKFDLTITCESEHGELFEGFDLWTKQKDAKALWEFFEDKETRTVNPIKEGVETEMNKVSDNSDKSTGVLIAEFAELPRGLQAYVNNTIDTINSHMKNAQYTENYSSNTFGTTTLRRNSNGFTEGNIIITNEFSPSFVEKYNNELMEIASRCDKKNNDPTKEVVFNGSYYEAILDHEYANLLFEYLENNVHSEIYTEPFEESYEFDPYIETVDPNAPAGLTVKETRRTMRTLSQDIINSVEKDNDPKISQYTLSIYSNLTTRNLLHTLRGGYHKFTLILDNKSKGNVVKFITPPFTRDFLDRFIAGRESIIGLLHTNPEIKISMTPSVFTTMKDPDDMYQFIKAAVRYYSEGVMKYSNQIREPLAKMGGELIHLVLTTRLSGLAVAPLKMIFAFDNVDLASRKIFTINKSDVDAVSSFIKSIYSRYASPDREKTKILNDLKEVIASLHEAYGSDEDMKELDHLAESVSDLYDGKYDKVMKEFKEKAIEEQVDRSWNVGPKANGRVKYYQEKWGVKKLKKLPRDLVAYISIETEAIRDYNDKAMIASYCISRLDICEWYIELLEVGSKKYIVPHTLPYLRQLRTDLLQCYDRIMKVKIEDKDKTVTVPPGYEG